MRRMMTTSEAAQTLGVTKGTIYRIVKQTGMRWRLEKRKGAYVFSDEDVIAP